MATKRWEDLKKRRISPARAREIREEVSREIMDADLKAMRELAGISQAELAKRMGSLQPEISRAESRGDHRLSTLRAYVTALGGELDVVAHFGDKTLRLHGI